MRRLFFAIVALALAPVASSAQARKDNWENLKQLQPGHKIKVADMSLKAWDGRLVSVSDEAITIRELRKQQEITVERDKVLRVTDLERSRRGRNALIGLAVGTALGFGVLEPSEDRVGLALWIFGAPGAAVGAFIPSRPTIYRAQHGPPKATTPRDGSPPRL